MNQLTDIEKEELKKIATMIEKKRPLPDVEQAWEDVIEYLNNKGTPVDIDAVVDWVLKQAYQDTDELYGYSFSSQEEFGVELKRKAKAVISRRLRRP